MLPSKSLPAFYIVSGLGYVETAHPGLKQAVSTQMTAWAV